MMKIQIMRSLLAIVTMVTLWSVPMVLQATGLQSLVVTRIALDKVTIAHPTPKCPPAALKLGIGGHVRVTADYRPLSSSHMISGIRQNAYVQVSHVRFSWYQYFLVLTESFSRSLGGDQVLS
jgi:hypothetical protein